MNANGKKQEKHGFKNKRKKEKNQMNW